MPDNDTLLAYLVSSFPGNTEDIATEAVRHIFDHSDACGVALNDVIQSDGTRPDLVGFDETGMERVLIEVKFWKLLCGLIALNISKINPPKYGTHWACRTLNGRRSS